jgi:hypothetical protein
LLALSVARHVCPIEPARTAVLIMDARFWLLPRKSNFITEKRGRVFTFLFSFSCKIIPFALLKNGMNCDIMIKIVEWRSIE